MGSALFYEFIDYFSHLKYEEKEVAFDLIKNQMAATERKRLVKRVKEADRNYKKGNYKKGTIADLYADLEHD